MDQIGLSLSHTYRAPCTASLRNTVIDPSTSLHGKRWTSPCGHRFFRHGRTQLTAQPPQPSTWISPVSSPAGASLGTTTALAAVAAVAAPDTATAGVAPRRSCLMSCSSWRRPFSSARSKLLSLRTTSMTSAEMAEVEMRFFRGLGTLSGRNLSWEGVALKSATTFRKCVTANTSNYTYKRMN